jgi:hypothetical protein
VRVERATTRLIFLDTVADFLRGSGLLPQGSHSRGLVTRNRTPFYEDLKFHLMHRFSTRLKSP